MQAMTLISYGCLVHGARLRRRAERRAHHGTLPHLLPGAALTGRFNAASIPVVSAANIPVAAVVQPAPREDPPVATSATSAETAPAPALARPLHPPTSGTHACSTSTSMTAVEVTETAWVSQQDPMCDHAAAAEDTHQPHACAPAPAPAPQPHAVAESVETEGASERALGMGVRMDSTHTRHAPRNVLPDSAEQAAEEAARGGGGQGWRGYAWKLWDSVREDPRRGFRCTSSHDPATP